MKKIILVFSLIACFSISRAQVTIPKTVSSSAANFIKPPAIGDIGGTTKGIVDMLGSKLALPDGQKPQLTDVISGFLTKKKDITGLASTNPTDYLSKFNPLQKGLFDKMKGIMGATAFTKFLGLKPSGSGVAGNLLSHLFF
jgi:hypothetical protein